MHNLAGLFVLLFLAMTFLQSGYDKFTDYKGNLSWLQDHFKGTFIQSKINNALQLILLLELIAGLFCVVGIIEISISGGTMFGKYGCVFSCITLLLLLFGQRIAKDYDGARTIVIYFVPAILGLYWFN